MLRVTLLRITLLRIALLLILLLRVTLLGIILLRIFLLRIALWRVTLLLILLLGITLLCVLVLGIVVVLGVKSGLHGHIRLATIHRGNGRVLGSISPVKLGQEYRYSSLLTDVGIHRSCDA